MTVTIGRRELLTALSGAVAWPLAARAQQPADQFHRVGILHSGTEASVARYLTTFRDGMRQLGYVEGRNLVISAFFTPFFFGLPLHGRCIRVPHFEPIGPAAGAIHRVLALRHDAFAAIIF